MVSDVEIHGLVERARGGEETALGSLVQQFIEADFVRGWAVRRAAKFGDDAVQDDVIVSLVQETVWHAACDEQGAIRWDENRVPQVPFRAWVMKVASSRCVVAIARESVAKKRRSKWAADYHKARAVVPSPVASLDARVDLGTFVHELRRAGRIRVATVLQLLSEGYSISDVAFELFGDASFKRRRAVSRDLMAAKAFCRERFCVGG